MKLAHKSVLIGGAVACVVLIASYHLAKQAVLGPKPFCHISVDAALTEMMLARQKSGDQSLAYPNESGDSRKSIEVVAARIGATDAVHLRRDYAYVPGLKESDSAELILLYIEPVPKSPFLNPTRRRGHDGDVAKKVFHILAFGNSKSSISGDTFSLHRCFLLWLTALTPPWAAGQPSF